MSDPIVRVHDRLDTLIESVTMLTVSIAKMEAASNQQALDMDWMRGQFKARDERAERLIEQHNAEIARVDTLVSAVDMAAQKERSYVQGVGKAVAIAWSLIAAVIGVMYNFGSDSLGALVKKVDALVVAVDHQALDIATLKENVRRTQAVTTRSDRQGQP